VSIVSSHESGASEVESNVNFIVDLLATCLYNMSGGRCQDKKLTLVMLALEN
jgi:hypothetical protein